MSDRPSGDHIDQVLREVTRVVAESVGPLPEQPERLLRLEEHPMAMPNRTRRLIGIGALSAAAAVIVALVLILGGDDEDSTPDVISPTPETQTPDPENEDVNEGVNEAELTGDALRTLFEEVSQGDRHVLGTAEGAFDLVTFDPTNPDQLLAVKRAGLGDAENQDQNELWIVGDGTVQQELWRPDTAHDFAYFNGDGSITMWTGADDGSGFPTRAATIIYPDGSTSPTSAGRTLARSVTVDDVVFTINHLDGENYVSLLRDDLTATSAVEQTLGGAQEMYWVDSPQAGIVVAYPSDDRGVTRTWGSSTLDEIPHPLAGLDARRLAISGDGAVGVLVDSTGTLIRFDPETGESGDSFGELELGFIDRPLTLNRDGSMLITVDANGQVQLWSMADGTVAVSFASDATPARNFGRGEVAPYAGPVIAPDASRVALRTAAIGTQPVTYTIIDTDLDNWRALGAG